MRPTLLDQMDSAFSSGQHVILSLNTQDRFYWPEEDIRPAYLPYFLSQGFGRQGYRVALYNPPTGVVELTARQNGTGECSRMFQDVREPWETVTHLVNLLRTRNEQWLVLIQYGEHLAPGGEYGQTREPAEERMIELLHQVALDDTVAVGKSRLVLITYESLPSALLLHCRGYRQVVVGLPQDAERREFILFLEKCQKARPQKWANLDPRLDVNQVVRLTAGMTLVDIERLFLANGHAGEVVGPEEIREVKARTIRESARDLLEVSEPQEGFSQTAGLRSVKEYLQLLIQQILAGRPGVPQGVLLHGVPGCGKSHLVKALACEMSWPLLELRNIRGPFVGQSEQQLEHVIRIVEQLQPCILFTDEIDQSLGQRGTGPSGDSGTSERMLARIFSWLGDMHLRGRVLFVGATNRPDILDPALLDRFGVAIPFLRPSRQEIRELIPLLLKRFDRELATEKDFDEVVSALVLVRPSGRSIQEILIHAGFLADREANRMGLPVALKHIRRAVQDHIPPVDPLELDYLSLCSLSKCSTQALLPWNSLDGLCDRQDIPEDLVKREIVDPQSGYLNLENLHNHIHQLAQERSWQHHTR